MPSEEEQASVAGGEESVQQLPSSVVADVADGEDKYVAAFKEKMDEAVDKSMIKSRVQDLPLDKLLKTLQGPLLAQAELHMTDRSPDAPKHHYILAMRFMRTMTEEIPNHPEYPANKRVFNEIMKNHLQKVLADATLSKAKVEVIARKSYKEQRARAEKAAVAAAAAAALEEAAAAKRKASGMASVNFVALGDAMNHPALPRSMPAGPATVPASFGGGGAGGGGGAHHSPASRSVASAGGKKGVTWGNDEEFVFGVPVVEEMPVLLPGENRMTFDTFMHRNRGGDYAVARNRPVPAPPPQPQSSRSMNQDDQFNAQLQQAMLLSQQEGNVDAERLNRLKDRLAKYTELELQDVDSSGHCQFDAIAHQIFGRFAKEYPGGSGYNYRKVRNDLADWLLRNKHFNIDDTGTTITDFLDHEDGDTWELFVDNIRDSQVKKLPTWGNHLTLIAAANLYERPIRVWSTAPGDDWWLQVDPKHYKPSHSIRPFELAHLYERHYMSVTERRTGSGMRV